MQFSCHVSKARITVGKQMAVSRKGKRKISRRPGLISITHNPNITNNELAPGRRRKMFNCIKTLVQAKDI